jgi:1,4-alpha-glucan branching enzyme
MKKILLFASMVFSVVTILNAQQLLSWSPQFPQDNSTITITVDCSKGNQGLFNFEGGNSSNVYVHTGVITNLSANAGDWKYSKFNWGTADVNAKATPLGNNKYQYTITNPRTFFGVPAGETIKKVTMIFRNAAGNNSIKQVNSDNSDMYIPVYASGEYAVRFLLPPFEPRFVPWVEPINVTVGSTLPITGIASASSSLTLKLNGSTIATTAAASTISNTPTITVGCENKIMLEGNDGSGIKKDSFSFFIPATTTTAPLPAGVQEGINYSANNTEVTLVLFAPNKNNVVVIGDFSNWAVQCANQMNRTADGKYYHIKLTGLTPGAVYKFQYLVDGNIKTTDPYTELILDPNNDGFINASTFPNMPAYPTGLTTGIVGTFQTAAPTYTWTASGYTRPDKKNLLVYELWLGNFLASSNWQTLADTLDYIKNLGINAIEVMPFNEFEGNNSWGYNPSFFFAPDKAYGTKNNLKRFVDEAHKRGIAVIMDAVLNHATGLSPLAQLYWNASTNQPAANSPYFNVNATHPFSVFNDFNHASDATKYHTSRYIRHWLTEYKLDGFRWDLSKGFTQKVCADVNCWNQYDAPRVATWQRYYDSIQTVSSGAYCILEHLGNDDEESDLANRGMLLWGKMTDQFNENTMGYSPNSSIDRAFYKNRAGWNQPHLVTYAESHDEERLMYKNVTFGNSSGTYNVKTEATAIARTEAIQPFLLLLPGPKMIWQFGELANATSIFACTGGNVPQPYGNDQCKLASKPLLWSQTQEVARKQVYKVIGALNRLRAAKPNVFLSNTISGNIGADLKKTLIINHPDLGVVVVGNFELTAQSITVTFPTVGTWYNYLAGGTITATGTAQTITLQPGDYRVFTSQNIPGGVVLPPVVVIPPTTGGTSLAVQTKPNPLGNIGVLKYVVPSAGVVTITIVNTLGQKVIDVFSGSRAAGTYEITIDGNFKKLAKGNYFIRIEQNGQKALGRFVKL